MSSEAAESRRTETDMGGSDEQILEILTCAAVGIVQISLEGQWLRVNKAYCDLLGYSESELRAKTQQEITHPDDWDEILAGRQQLLAGEISAQTIEKRYLRKDGTYPLGEITSIVGTRS
jgi:diguanylate cyclase